MKVSICFMTLDRYEYTKQTLENNLFNHGFSGEIEFLWCDNGSKDPRMFTLVEKYNPHYFRGNRSNEGCAKGFNQLLIRATGDYLVLMGNDVLMPPDWLNEMVKYADFIPNSGLIGIKCTAQIPELSFKHNCWGHFIDDKCDKVFGVTLFKRSVLETIGGFCEEFGPYALEDSNFNDRVNYAGLVSVYVPSNRFVSKHIGEDVGQGTEYRKMKDESMGKNTQIFVDLRDAYKSGRRPIKEELPPMREPLK